jgi:hypothetical protein
LKSWKTHADVAAQYGTFERGIFAEVAAGDADLARRRLELRRGRRRARRCALPTSKFGAVVLDHRVRVQDVGADLRAEVDVLRLARSRDLLALRSSSSSSSSLERSAIAVALLADCERSFWHCTTIPGRPVGDAHRRVGLVDVLAAGARRAVGVDLQVVVVDLDVAVLLDDRRDLDAREARLAAVRGVERRERTSRCTPFSAE